MQIFLSYLGCRLNQAELELWARQFNHAGHSVVSNAEEADLMVLNSCAVTQEAVRKSRKNIKQLKRRNPQAKIVVSGCFVSLQDETGNHETAQALAVDLVVHNGDKTALVAQSCKLFDSPIAIPATMDLIATGTGNDASQTEQSQTDRPRTESTAATGLSAKVFPNSLKSSATDSPTISMQSAMHKNAAQLADCNGPDSFPAGWIPLKSISVKPIAAAASLSQFNATTSAQPSLLQPPLKRSRQRAFIKIQDGCRYRCTYCVVTLARGDEISRPIAELVKEVNTLVTEGVKEIVLTGVHVGGYGSDTGESLASLLQALLADTDVPRIRFASVEPWDLEEDLLTCMLDPRVMPHMHLPLQSGSDAVLKRMSRRCKTTDFRQLVNELQASIAGFNVTTDIIVGFPGETESEWRETLEFVNTIAFGHIHVFPFSVRAGTKAARLPGQLTGDIKKQRVRQLRELAIQQRQEFLQQCVGREVEVLWERFTPQTTEAGQTGINNGATVHGLTPNYIRVFANLPATSSGQHSNTDDTLHEDAHTHSGSWVNKITRAALRQVQVIPGKSENELTDYKVQAQVPADVVTAIDRNHH